MKKTIWIVFVLLVMPAVAFPATVTRRAGGVVWTPLGGRSGATYYLDNVGGSDANSGASPYSAWKTLAKIDSRAFSPGDQILFKRGGTWAENVTVDIVSSGESESPIYFGTYGTGDRPDLNFLSNSGEGFKINGKSHIVIDGLYIHDAAREGIFVTSDPSARITDISIKDCVVKDCGDRTATTDAGIDVVFTDGLLIQGVTFDSNYRCGLRVSMCSLVKIDRCEAKNHGSADDFDGFLIQNVDGMLMQNCLAYNNGESGIDIGGYEGYAGYNMKNAYMVGCLTYGNLGEGLSVSGPYDGYESVFSTSWIYFISCIDSGSAANAINVYDNVSNVFLYNCTFDGAGTYGVRFYNDVHYVNMVNTIVSNSATGPGYVGGTTTPTNLVFDHTLWYPTAPGGSYNGTNYINANPLFVDRANRNFALQSSSPAKDTGYDFTNPLFSTGLVPGAVWPGNVVTAPQSLFGASEVGAFVYVP